MTGQKKSDILIQVTTWTEKNVYLTKIISKIGRTCLQDTEAHFH